MKKLFYCSVLFAASLAFLQCSQSKEESPVAACEEAYIEGTSQDECEPDAKSLPQTNSEDGPSGTFPAGKKMEKRVDVTIDSKQTSLCREYVDSLIVRFHAYVENETFSNYKNSYRLTIRVPAASLDSFVAGLSGTQGTIVDKSVCVEDRTAEYTDLSSRKKTQEAMLDNYRQMLSRATKISDMLEIQNRIDEIQMAADRSQGRLNQIDHNVNYSVLEIRIEDKSYVSPDTDDDSFTLGDFGRAIANGWHGLIMVLWAILNLWPLWIFIAGVIYLVGRYKKRK